MADQLLRDLLGDALLNLADRHQGAIKAQLRDVADWLGDVARPPPGMELRTMDGTRYTGIGVFEQNRLVMLLALRHEPAASRNDRPFTGHEGHRPMWAEEPIWSDEPYFR